MSRSEQVLFVAQRQIESSTRARRMQLGLGPHCPALAAVPLGRWCLLWSRMDRLRAMPGLKIMALYFSWQKCLSKDKL